MMTSPTRSSSMPPEEKSPNTSFLPATAVALMNKSFQSGSMDPWEFFVDNVDEEGRMARNGLGLFYTTKAFHKHWNSAEVSKPGENSVVHLFRQNIDPLPDDKSNIGGMQIVFDCNKKVKSFHVVWVDLVLVLVTGGDIGAEAGRAINGVSCYPDLHTIHVWLKTDNPTACDAVICNLKHAVPPMNDADVKHSFLVNKDLVTATSGGAIALTPQDSGLPVLMTMSFSPGVFNHSFSDAARHSGSGMRRSRSLPPVGDREDGDPGTKSCQQAQDVPAAANAHGDVDPETAAALQNVERVASFVDSRSCSPSPTHAGAVPSPQRQQQLQQLQQATTAMAGFGMPNAASMGSSLAGGYMQSPAASAPQLPSPGNFNAAGYSSMEVQPNQFGGGDPQWVPSTNIPSHMRGKQVSFHDVDGHHPAQQLPQFQSAMLAPGGAQRRTHSAGGAGENFNGRYHSLVGGGGGGDSRNSIREQIAGSGILQSVDSWEDPDWVPPSMLQMQQHPAATQQQQQQQPLYVDPRTLTYDGGFFPTPAQVQDNLQGFLNGSLPMSGITGETTHAQQVPRSNTGHLPMSNFLNPAFSGYGRAPFDWKENSKSKQKQYGLYHAVDLTLVARFCRDTYLPQPLAQELQLEEGSVEIIDEEEVKYSKSRSPRNRRKIRERKIREAADFTRREMRVWCPLYGAPPLAWVAPKENRYAPKPEVFSEEEWWRFVQACRKNQHAINAVATLEQDVLLSLGMPDKSPPHEEALRNLQHVQGPTPNPLSSWLLEMKNRGVPYTVQPPHSPPTSPQAGQAARRQSPNTSPKGSPRNSPRSSPRASPKGVPACSPPGSPGSPKKLGFQ